VKEEFNFSECPNQKFLLPYVIIALHKLGGSGRRQEVVDELAQLLNLSAEILEETTRGSSEPKFRTTVAWARNALLSAGYIDNTIYGIWQLTQKGSEAFKYLESREHSKLENFRVKVTQEGKKPDKKEPKSEIEQLNFSECPSMKILLPYVILVLHKLGGSGKRQEVVDELARLLDLSDEILEETNPKSSEPKFRNTVAWARKSLVDAEYIDNTTYGLWELTQSGREVVKILESRKRSILDNFRIKVIQKSRETIERRRQSEDNIIQGKLEEIDIELKGEYDEERSLTITDLEKLKKLDPYKFERLCVRLLKAAGYEDVEVTSKSRDGGLDGIGFLTIDLIRFKVIFQAKCYTTIKVKPKEIDELAGVQFREKAEKALFITTSDFTQEATKRAFDHCIELISGEKLIKLLFNYEVGYRKMLDEEFLEKL